MKRRTQWILAGAAAVAVAALALAWRTPPALVETAEVTRGPFTRVISDDGITRVRERYRIDAPVGGTLLRVSVEEGDEVVAGQVVATIMPSVPQLLDPRTRAELTARRDSARARLMRARALQHEAATAVAQAELDAKRARELETGAFISHAEREKAELTLDMRRRDADAAGFEADAAEHDLAEASAALSRVRSSEDGQAPASASAWQVRSPVAGRVITVIEESAGPVTLGTRLIDVGDVNKLEAVIDVLSDQATAIPPQAPVTLTAGENVHLAGRVRTVEPAAQTKVSALGIEEQRVNVIVDLLPNPAQLGRVGDGYRVDARIEMERVDDALRVPVAALFRTGLQWAVYTVVDGRLRLRPVTIGARSEDLALVTTGLEAGTTVVLYPADSLTEGRRVRSLSAR